MDTSDGGKRAMYYCQTGQCLSPYWSGDGKLAMHKWTMCIWTQTLVKRLYDMYTCVANVQSVSAIKLAISVNNPSKLCVQS